ncbi:MAG: hypothetical protein BGP12_17030 [Rhodospirillales bacterium 70-18]|nr:hypothetical protein [Rhodospirillales bacterium]OJY64219.1 MAG: hypothetical protein BGP12_17030 [Rhodospirillales bacterium 70-18]
MIPSLRPLRALALLAPFAPLAVAGCAAPLSHGDSARLAACRARAEEVYSVQNRADVYRDDAYASSVRDTPYAGASGFAATSGALSGRYQREQMVDRCMRGAAGNVGSTPDAPDPAKPSGASHLPTPSPLAVPPKP